MMRRVMRTTSIAICLAVAVSGCETAEVYAPAPAGTAQEETAQRPSFNIGDEFWFHTRGRQILVEQYEGMAEGLHTFRRALQNETLYYSPDMALVRVERGFGDDTKFDPDDGALVFPLAVGAKWDRTYRLSSERSLYTGRRTRRCEVVERGQVQTQAGTFKVFRIACTTNTLGETPSAPDEIFYAPSVGRIVLTRTLGRGNELSLIDHIRAE